MDLNQIQSLIKFVSKSGVNEVELETKDFKINIKTTKAGDPATQVMMPAQAYMPAQPVPAAPAPAPAPAAPAAPASSAEADKAKDEDNSKYITVKSPMIGNLLSLRESRVRCICKRWR